MNKLANVSGMAAISDLSGVVTDPLRQKMLKAATLSLFVYLAHEPLMMTFEKANFQMCTLQWDELRFYLPAFTPDRVCDLSGRRFPDATA
jgi:hypothetical protein